MKEIRKGRAILLVVYIIAFGLGFWVSTVSNYPIIVKSAVAAGVAVLIIFMGSLDFNNSSVFDPYWSIAPPLMVLYYLAMVVADAIGIVIGVIMRRHIPERSIKWFSAIVFILFGLHGVYRVLFTH